jgi:hypothetical protein
MSQIKQQNRIMSIKGKYNFIYKYSLLLDFHTKDTIFSIQLSQNALYDISSEQYA